MKALVVASYKESLAWTRDVPKDWQVLVYNTDPDRREFDCDVPVVKLPNIAREAGQWLHHFASTRPADITVCVQGDPFAHTKNLLELLSADDFSHEFCYLNGDYAAGALIPQAVYTMRYLWQGQEVPPPIRYKLGGQFYVKKELVEKAPPEHYARLLSCPYMKQPGFSLAHILETCWRSVFPFGDEPLPSADRSAALRVRKKDCGDCKPLDIPSRPLP